MNSEHFTIVIDRDIVEEYNKEYFRKNPRSRKSYFMNDWKTKKKNPKSLYSVLSLNDIIPINSMSYGNLKQKWGDFGLWLAKKYNLENKNYKNIVLEYKVFSETKAKKDLDNIAGGFKLLFDALGTKSGMVEDDNYFIMNPLIISADYNKDYPHSEIRVSIIDENVKDIYEKMSIHINNFKQ